MTHTGQASTMKHTHEIRKSRWSPSYSASCVTIAFHCAATPCPSNPSNDSHRDGLSDDRRTAHMNAAHAASPRKPPSGRLLCFLDGYAKP
ncbi:hypothetical protein Bphy_3083 [Paraburkholderia phymatum STM815]|uniref:Uncharacterized protein n=1 Tax=Paraburkholderia phymatum (strain DSM 17167 / CIP 108236 / LMG 21445 / STM815) TaxID=391038 RepID=B2JJQ3_PARP8|nr:hypothetical protein Bphy_3083 [Paraburkholderia phymatum STM815]